MDKLVRKIEIPLARRAIERAGLYIVKKEDLDRLAEVAAQSHRKLYIPSLALCGDNAAMIGAQGYYEYLAGKRDDSTLNASALDGIR